MDPLKVALIGCGRRGQHVYFPILQALKQVVTVVAVCDRVPEFARAGAETFAVPAYESLKQLVKDRPMEAAIVVTPPLSHHAISCFLSANGIHNLVETPICDALSHAREMMAVAERHRVVCRVGEQFFRDPFDVLARAIIAGGVIGKVGRVTNYHAHLGYHNNSRHQVMAGAAPVAVNAVEHTMSVQPYRHGERYYESETFTSLSLHFPGGLLITDLAGNVKSPLGRYSRPGLHEIDGMRGAIVMQSAGHWKGRAEVRVVPPERFLDGSGAFSVNYPILYGWRLKDGSVIETDWISKWPQEEPGTYLGAYVELPQGRFSANNDFAELGIMSAYHPEVAGHVRDFAMLVRSGKPDFFTPAMAIMSLQMDHAMRLSARRGGARVDINDRGLDEIDQERLADFKQRTEVDPDDLEAVIDYCFRAG